MRKNRKSKQIPSPISFGMDVINAPNLVLITPEMALNWLENYSGANRDVVDTTVNKYAADMKANKWRVVGSSIAFSKTGRLLDGQHRLWACVVSNAPFRCIIWTGLDDEDILDIDTGMPRRRGTILTLVGESNGTLLASACMWVWKMQQGRENCRHRANSPSSEVIAEILKKHPRIRNCVAQMTGINATVGSKCKVGMSIAVMFFMGEALPTKKYPDTKKAALEFFTRLLTGQNLSEGDPAATLRNRIYRYKVSKKKISPVDLITWYAYAWIAFLKGKKIGKISPRTSMPQFPGSPNFDVIAYERANKKKKPKTNKETEIREARKRVKTIVRRARNKV